MPKVVVVGGGPAGVSAALRARELGVSVTLVERGKLGGTCTNRGCVPVRVLAKAARLWRDAQQLSQLGLGLPPPELDFPALLRQVEERVGEVQSKKRLSDHLSENGITVREAVGTAFFQDPHTLVLEQGESLRADTFILCPGGYPRKPNLPGSEYALTILDLWELKTLPRSMVIVGGSATGCQLASLLATFGIAVTLLEAAERLLPAEDSSVSEAIRTAFIARGIRVLTHTPPLKRLEKTEAGLSLAFEDDTCREPVVADALLFSIGWPGNLEALHLEAAGVATHEDFIQVDDSLRTSAPHIYAAGDVTGRLLLVPSAMHEGRYAAESCLGHSAARIASHRNVPHGGFTDPEYAGVGQTVQVAQEQADCLIVQVPYSELDRAVIDQHPEGFCKLIVARRTGALRGAYVVGEQALEVVQAVAAGMAAGITVEQLADVEFAYPTFTAILGIAARQACKELHRGPASAVKETLTHPRATEWEQSALSKEESE